MEKSISAADFRRKFSQLLRSDRRGQSYVITNHGKAVARIAPFTDNRFAVDFARESLFHRLRAEPVLKVTRSKMNRTMDRVFELLAGLPNDPQPSVEKGRPQKRKGL